MYTPFSNHLSQLKNLKPNAYQTLLTPIVATATYPGRMAYEFLSGPASRVENQAELYNKAFNSQYPEGHHKLADHRRQYYDFIGIEPNPGPKTQSLPGWEDLIDIVTTPFTGVINNPPTLRPIHNGGSYSPINLNPTFDIPANPASNVNPIATYPTSKNVPQPFLVGVEPNPGPPKKTAKKTKLKQKHKTSAVLVPPRTFGRPTVYSAPPMAYGIDPSPMTVIKHIKHRGSEGVRITSRFRVGSCTTNGTLSTTGTSFQTMYGANLDNFLLDPNQTSKFPANIYSMAQFYTKFRIVRLGICYAGEVSSATNGSVAVTYVDDPDFTYTAPLNSGSMYNTWGASGNTFTARVWSPCTEKEFKVDTEKEYYMVAASSDSRLLAPGYLWFASNGLTTSTVYGSYWLTIGLEFYGLVNTISNTFRVRTLLDRKSEGSRDDRTALIRQLVREVEDSKEKPKNDVEVHVNQPINSTSPPWTGPYY